MSFQNYLKKQIEKHPSMRARDLVKLCYQAAFGPEHLLSDLNAAEIYFYSEFKETEEKNADLYEEISRYVCRINIGAWKREKLPPKWLFSMFANSFSIKSEKKDILELLEECGRFLESASGSVASEEWSDFVCEYKKLGMPAVHHSEAYRKEENPHYRIVNKAYLRILPILREAARIEGGKMKIIAIDGRAASGKSSIAELLSGVLGAAIVHMDDFFLPMELRYGERLAEVGGNIHYERFCDEVLPCAKSGKDFSYGIFDCSKMKISGKRNIKGGEWLIVEGSYSHHKIFGDYADLKVFCTVEPHEQMARIIKREGEQFAKKFKDVWIPMEEEYLEAFNIRNNADIVIK